jgi:5-methylthioribose kinase
MEKNKLTLTQYTREEIKEIFLEAFEQKNKEGNTQHQIKMPQFLTCKQVAEILGKHEMTIRKWEKEGKISVANPTATERYSTKEVLQIWQDMIDGLL